MQQFFPSFPQYGNPYQPPRYQPPAQPSFLQAQDSLIRVTGIEGAKAYPVAANTRTVLFDEGRDVFYIKATDAGGYPTLAAYTFAPLQESAAPAPDYVTREEFNQLKELIENGKQPVRKAKQPDPAE